MTFEDCLVSQRMTESTAPVAVSAFAPDVGMVLQRADGTIQACNPTAQQILGVTLEQLQEWICLAPSWQAIQADGSPFSSDAHPAQVTLRTGQPCVDVRMGVLKPQGERVWLSIRTEPLAGAGGIPYGVMVTFVETQTSPPADEPEPPRETDIPPEEVVFFERSLDLLAIVGLNGHFKRMNAQFVQTLGYDERDLLATPFLELVHPDDRPASLAEMAKLEAGAPTLYFENRYRVQDGTYRWLAWTASPQLEKGVIYCGARDITDQKWAETARLERSNRDLYESEQRLRVAVDHIPDAFVIYDAQRRIQFVNAAGLTLTGRPLEDFLGRTDKEIHPPEVTRSYLPLLKQAVATRCYQTGECTITLPNRPPYTIVVQYVPLLDAQGELQQILGITYDITERKRAEAVMLRNAHQIRRILDSLFSFVGVMTPDGILIEANRTALDAAALHPKDVLDKPFEEAYWWSYSPEVQAQLRWAIARAAQGETVRYDVMVRVKDERLITIDFSLAPLLDAEGQVEYLIPSGIDITDRKQTEHALEESRAQVQRQLAEIETIYQSAPIGLGVLDTDLRFVRINQRLAEINGFSVEEHIGRTVRELLPELADTAEQTLRPILTNGEPLLNVEIVGETPAQPGVQRVWMENFLPLKDGDRVIGINTVCEEITERKRIEAALRESEANFRNMADTAPVMIWVTDASGYCTYLSQTWYDFTGQTEATGLGYGWLDAVHPDDYESTRDTFLQANQQRIGFRLEYRLRNQEGVYHWAIDAASPRFGGDGEFKGYVGSVLDISDRKQVEAALHNSEERYRTLFESMEDGFCVVEVLLDEANTPVDYRFLEINPAFERQTGLQQAEGKTARELLPDLEDFWIKTYGSVALTGKALRFENGSEVMQRWFDVYACRVGNPDKRKVAILFREISDRKAMEVHREQLLHQEQAAREAAERANRMKDEFLAVLSHELRTPLNPILGWSKLLQSPQVNPQKLQQGLTTIERNAKQQVQLIDDLLDVSRIIRGQLTLNFEPITLSDPIMAALETVRLAVEAKHIQLKVFMESNVGQVRGDSVRLQQVVWNLLTNAIKFTPSGGRVTVQLAQVERYAQIKVSDTGKGIEAEFLPHVFELFRQQDSSTTRQFGGLGLGLAIVRQIVEAHGGTIAADSDGEGHGAVFTVQLPMMTTLAARPPDALPKPSPSFENLQILVVDDEVDSLELVRVLLEEEGARVQAVTSPTDALRLLTQTSFNLLISDIGMPELDGYAFIRQVRTLTPLSKREIPAIALTAYAGETNQNQILAAGFQTHLAKPIELQQLLDAIIALVG